jgi:hypothetical protein
MGLMVLQTLIVIAFGWASLYFIDPHTVLGMCLTYGLTVSLLHGVLRLLSWPARRRREPSLYPDPRRGLQSRLTARRGSEEGLELWDGVWVGEKLGQVIDASAEPESLNDCFPAVRTLSGRG